MKFLALVLSVLLVIAPVAVFASDGGVTVDVDSRDIVWMGRWEKENGLMHGSFECGLVLRFTGTGISLRGEASGKTLIAVDGGDVEYFTLSENAVLFSGLENGEHTLEIYSAAQQCFPVVGGFTLDPGARTLPSPNGKTVEFVGDSITEGYVDPKDAPPYDANSYRYSYAFLTGRKLMQDYGVRFNTVAYGGICLVERGDNSSGNDPLGMPERYFLNREYKTQITAEEERKATHKWDTETYTPDVVVINLGTNDVIYSNQKVSAAALTFLQNLRGAYENTVILVMTPFNRTKSNPLKKAVDAMNDEKILLIDTKEWNIKAGSDGLHPAPAAHILAAEFMYETLKPYIETKEEPITTEAPQTERPTEEPTGAPAETPDTAQNGGENGGSASALPYIIIGIITVAAAVFAVAIIVKKRK